MSPSAIEILATVLFVLAIVHTFSTKLFTRLAETWPAHAGFLHLLGEVETVFGFWAMVLVVAIAGGTRGLRASVPLIVQALLIAAGAWMLRG